LTIFRLLPIFGAELQAAAEVEMEEALLLELQLANISLPKVMIM
jgi:hypothetical protein